jgi:hypothetical protein
MTWQPAAMSNSKNANEVAIDAIDEAEWEPGERKAPETGI